MNSIKRNSIQTIAYIVVFYLAACLVGMSFNPFEWQMWIRAVFAFLSVMILLFFIENTNFNNSND